MNIAGFYNESNVQVWDVYGRALVEVSDSCVVGCPLEDSPGSAGACAGRRSIAFRMREENLQRETVVSFGDLSNWANRRAGCWRSTKRQDWQLVLGALFNRRLVREGIQWLYEHRTPVETPVTIGLLEAIGKCGRTGHMLVMRCGEWEAAVMCALGEQQGDDPLGEVVA